MTRFRFNLLAFAIFILLSAATALHASPEAARFEHMSRALNDIARQTETNNFSALYDNASHQARPIPVGLYSNSSGLYGGQLYIGRGDEERGFKRGYKYVMSPGPYFMSKARRNLNIDVYTYPPPKRGASDYAKGIFQGAAAALLSVLLFIPAAISGVATFLRDA